MSSISLSPVSLDDVDAASDCAWEAFQGNEAMRPHFPKGGHNSPEVKQWKVSSITHGSMAHLAGNAYIARRRLSYIYCMHAVAVMLIVQNLPV